MSERVAHDALPHGLPRAVRSKLLDYGPRVTVQNSRLDNALSDSGYPDDEVSIPDFKYTSLPPNRKCIRLLRLYPGVLDNPQIDCEIFEAEFKPETLEKPDGRFKLVRISSLNTGNRDPREGVTIINGDARNGSSSNGHLPTQNADSTLPTTGSSQGRERGSEDNVKPDVKNREPIEYEALSWRWGDEKNGAFAIMIHKNGVLYRKRVSETLGLALKCLRYEKDRYLWIDAICIDQEDSYERSSQVSMMSLVYTSAQQACVWLGEDDEMSTMAFRFIREEIRGLKNFDQLCTDEIHAPKWRALLVLMQRPWFSRRWVVQEIVLARGATVYCGPEKIPWRELAIAVELFVEVETATHRLSELMKKDEKFRLIPSLFEHISELGASILVNATGKVFRESKHADNAVIHPSHGKEVLPQRSLLSLEYLVTSLSIFDCGRPHDSVYSLVAVARDARPVAPSALSDRTKESLVLEVCSDFLQEKPYVLNYNRPYADVCKDFVHFCILRCATHDKIQALNILCRPWAKDWRPGEGKYDILESKPSGPHTEVARERLIRHQGSWKKRFKHDRSEVIDHRNMNQYWDEAKHNYPVDPIIAQWFPAMSVPTDDTRGLVEDHGSAIRANTSTRLVARKKKKTDQRVPEIDYTRVYELALPSWVTRITAAPFDIFPHPGMDMVKMGRKNADPLAGVPQDGYRNYSAGQTKRVDLDTLTFRRRPRHNHYSLYVTGFWFDTVEEVAQVSQGGAIPGTWLDLAGWSSARRPTRPDADIGDPPDAFWRTLVADRGAHDRNPPYYYARACKETIIKGGLRSGAVDTTALIYNERNSIVAEFCRRVQAVIWNRALIKTSNGFLGLVSDGVKEGDQVCIIYGCTVPIILRKGIWKTEREHNMERYEDSVETMKILMRTCETNRARKARWIKEKPKASPEDLEKMRILREKFNADTDKTKKQKKPRKLTENYVHIPSDNESDDDTDPESDDNADDGNTARSKITVPNDNATTNRNESSMRRVRVNVVGQRNGVTDEASGSTAQEFAEGIEGTQGNAGQGLSTVQVSSATSDSVDITHHHSGEAMAEDPEADMHALPRPYLQRSDTTSRKRAKQQKANDRDYFRHYRFFGEAYIHGMMDGEAVRQNFYKGKPDHVFEIR